MHFLYLFALTSLVKRGDVDSLHDNISMILDAAPPLDFMYLEQIFWNPYCWPFFELVGMIPTQ